MMLPSDETLQRMSIGQRRRRALGAQRKIATDHVKFLRNLSDEYVAISPNRSTDLDAAANEMDRMRAAILRQVENIERWRETGEPASPEDSKSIYEQLCTAIGREPIS